MMKAGMGRTLAVAVASVFLFGSSVVLSEPAVSAQEAIDDSAVFEGDNGPPAGSERLEAVRANGGVDEDNQPFVPQAIDTSDPAKPETPIPDTPVPETTPATLPDATVPDTTSPAGTVPATTAAATTIPATPTPPAPPLELDSGVMMPPIPVPETVDVGLVVPVAGEAEFQTTVSELVAGVGGNVIDTFEGIALVDVPTPARPALTQQMRARGIELREPLSVHPPADAVPSPDFGPITPSILKLTRADQYHRAGYKGKGVKIGVIDYFDVSKYWNAKEHGARPAAGTSAKCLKAGRDCTSTIFSGTIGSDWDKHGEAVVEVIRDMAPEAQIYVATAYTITDVRAIMDWFHSKGVTIISRSLNSGYDNPGNGSGPESALPTYAAKRGMILVNGAGNEGDRKYYRHKVRLNGNYIVFGPSGNDPYLIGNGCMSIIGIRWANDWYLPAAQRSDYDFYLFTTNGSGDPQLLHRSERRQNQGDSPFEWAGPQVCPRQGERLFLVGVWRSGPRGGDTLEILDYYQGFTKYTTPWGSAGTAIDTSKEKAFLAVGAIDPPESGQIASYSSRGPTNDGRIVPSLSAPAGAANSMYSEGVFQGTSAATPCVSGGLALLQQSRLATGPRELADLARKSVIDRGPKGADNTYGTGQFRLPTPPSRKLPSKPSRFVPLAKPTRMLDTRPDSAAGPSRLIGKMKFGAVLRLPVRGVAGIPKNATAVAVNLTTTEADIPTYVQAFPTGYATKASYSNVNTDLGKQTRANFAIIPIGVDGTISLYSVTGGHVVVDALGYFVSAGATARAGRFRPLGAPERVLNTRGRGSPTGGKPLRDGDVVKVPMPKGIKASHISALVVTVTGAAPTQPALLQAYPRGTPKVRGETSTVNLDPKIDAANLAIVPITGGGINVAAQVINGGSVHAIVDVIGYITSNKVKAGGAGRFVPVVPARALDSREKGGFLTDRSVRTVRGSDAPGVRVPKTASAIMWNVTATETKRPGYARVWAYKTARPQTSNLNWGTLDQTIAAAAIAGAKQGASNFSFTSDTPRPVNNAQLIADVFGYFT